MNQRNLFIAIIFVVAVTIVGFGMYAGRLPGLFQLSEDTEDMHDGDGMRGSGMLLPPEDGGTNDVSDMEVYEIDMRETGPAIPSEEVCQAQCREQYGGSGSPGFDACIRACGAGGTLRGAACPSPGPACPTPQIAQCKDGRWVCIGPAEPAGGASAGGRIRETKEFSMTSYYDPEAKRPFFSLTEMSVKKGDTVRVKVTNTMGVHDFTLDEFAIKKETPLNEEVVVEFAADKAGDFVYYCSKPGHRQAGQWGTLHVAE